MYTSQPINAIYPNVHQPCLHTLSLNNFTTYGRNPPPSYARPKAPQLPQQLPTSNFISTCLSPFDPKNLKKKLTNRLPVVQRLEPLWPAILLPPRPLLFDLLEKCDYVSQTTGTFLVSTRLSPKVQIQGKVLLGSIGAILLHFYIAECQGKHQHVEFICFCRKGKEHGKDIVDTLCIVSC